MTLYTALFLGALVLSCGVSWLLWFVLKPWEKPLRQAHLEEPEEDARIEVPAAAFNVAP